MRRERLRRWQRPSRACGCTASPNADVRPASELMMPRAAPPAPSTSTSRPASATPRLWVRSRTMPGPSVLSPNQPPPSRFSVFTAPDSCARGLCAIGERKRLELEGHRDVESLPAVSRKCLDGREKAVQRREQPLIGQRLPRCTRKRLVDLQVRPDVTLEVVLRYLRRLDELPYAADQLFVVDRNERAAGSAAHQPADRQRAGNAGVGGDAAAPWSKLPCSTRGRQHAASAFERYDLVSAPERRRGAVGLLVLQQLDHGRCVAADTGAFRLADDQPVDGQHSQQLLSRRRRAGRSDGDEAAQGRSTTSSVTSGAPADPRGVCACKAGRR